MGYRDRTRKKVTLPSGATCFVRKFQLRDFLEAGVTPTKKEFTTEEQVKLMTHALCECVWGFESEGEKLAITSKPVADCSDSELSIDLLEQGDAAAIMQAIHGTEAGIDTRNFPEEPRHDSERSPNGADVRNGTVRVPVDATA